MNKENSFNMLRTKSNSENSGIDAKETSSLKTMIKGNVTSQQQSSLKHISNTYKKIDNNENTKEKKENNENTKGNNEKNNHIKGKDGDAKATQNTARKTFEGLTRSASSTSILSAKTIRSFQIGTEQLRSDTSSIEQPILLENKEQQVNLHHKTTKQLRIASTQTKMVEELKKKLDVLKQENEAKKERLAHTREIKNKIVREKMIKSRIEDLKKDIAEKEEIQEELLAIMKPIEENSRVKILKQKQDLVEELLNTLSFLNYEILELQEKA